MAGVCPCPLSPLSILREKRRLIGMLPGELPHPEVLLVSSPGFGVLDSGCGRSIIGRDTLTEFHQLWRAAGVPIPTEIHEVNHFRFGNGEKETTESVIRLPVTLGGKQGTIRTAIVRGQAPFLISRNALQTLKAVIDFGKQQLTLFEEQVLVPLVTNEAGQFAVKVVGSSDQVNFEQEVMCSTFTDNSGSMPSPVSEERPAGSSKVEQDSSIDHSLPGDSESLQYWVRHDSFLQKTPTIGKQGPQWQTVTRRRVVDETTNAVLFDEMIEPQKGKSYYHHVLPSQVLHTRTEFWFRPQELASTLDCLPVHYVRQLKSQLRDLDVQMKQPPEHGTPADYSVLRVAEVFCPPRFAPLVTGMGGECVSYDLLTGYDMSQASVRDQVSRELRETPPDLLVLCPPCTDEGGWFNIKSLNMTPQEVAHRVRMSRIFVRFCCELFRQQAEAGRQALLEHPRGIWSYPEMQVLLAEYFPLECDLCRYGLRLPDTDRLIQKPIRLLVSHASMSTLEKRCPGSHHPQHRCHFPVAGSHPSVGRVSTFTGKYTPAFVLAVMNTVEKYRALAKQVMPVCVPWTYHEHQVMMVKDDLAQDDEAVRKALTRLHKNLGHPSQADLVRLLKHAQASEKAIKLARQLSCDFCLSQGKPHTPLPGQTSHPTVFNHVVGMDVKHLRGWKPDQTIKALNLVDHASNYQLVLPFYEQETSQVLRQLFEQHWIRVFGPPKVVMMDPARTNLGEPMQSLLDSLGIHCKPIAAEAHWQLGRTERHGGWFGNVLSKLVQENSPESKSDWEQLVTQAHVKNTMIQNHGFTPFQFVFGRNPDVPTELLDEPLHVVPATLGLTDEAIRKAQEIRTTACKAVIDLQSDQSLRRALAARPRVTSSFQAGDLVAYWREQK